MPDAGSAWRRRTQDRRGDVRTWESFFCRALEVCDKERRSHLIGAGSGASRVRLQCDLNLLDRVSTAFMLEMSSCFVGKVMSVGDVIRQGEAHYLGNSYQCESQANVVLVSAPF